MGKKVEIYRYVLKEPECGHNIGVIFNKDDQWAICTTCYSCSYVTYVLSESLSMFVGELNE
jgi:hypothetical protein